MIKPHLAGTVVFTFLLFIGNVNAALSPVSSRSALGGNDVVDWSVLGSGPLVYPPNPFTIISTGGLSMSVSNTSASIFKVRVQGVSWGGNFANGDVLVGNASDNFPGPTTIDFDVPISAVGTQINAFDYGLFDATVEAFDSSGASLGVVAFPNLMTSGGGGNAAPFVGVRSDEANIDKVTFAIDNDALVINRVDLVRPYTFICGDIDGSGSDQVDISDLVYLVDYMFTAGPPPSVMATADLDGSGAIDISDLVYLVDFMFTGGPPPACL